VELADSFHPTLLCHLDPFALQCLKVLLYQIVALASCAPSFMLMLRGMFINLVEICTRTGG